MKLFVAFGEAGCNIRFSMKQEIEKILVIFAVILILFFAALLLIGVYLSTAWLMSEFPNVTALLFMCWVCYAVIRDAV